RIGLVPPPPSPQAGTADRGSRWRRSPRNTPAFKIEQRGIDLIPDGERKMTPAGLFWLWAGAVFNVEFFLYGTLIMTFGLSVAQARSEEHTSELQSPV